MAGASRTWDLTSFFPEFDGDTYRAHVATLDEAVGRLAAMAEALEPPTTDASSLARWAELFRLDEAVLADYSHWAAYVGCLNAADAANERYQQESARVATFGAAFRNAFAPVTEAFRLAAPEAVAALAEHPDMADLAYSVWRIKEEAERRMDPAQERLASDLGVNGIAAWGRLYNTLSGRLTFPMTAGEGGNRDVPMAQKRSLLESTDPAVRREALASSNAAWEGVEYVTAAALNAIAGTRLTLNKWRGVEDFMVEPLFQAATRPETLEAMWRAVEGHKAPVLEYLQRKAAMLETGALAFHDVMAPLPQAESPVYSWDEAVALVLESFDAAYPALGDYARRALEEGRVESEKREGKRPGAFCTTSLKTRHSYVFMTFGGSLGDVQTLAHELGHAFHAHVLRTTRPMASLYPMTLAETASTFAERLVQRAILDDPATNDGVKLQVLRARLDDAGAMCCDIRMRYLFEHSFYMERQHGEVSASRCKALMLQAQHDAYGGVLDPDHLDPMFWASKLHFYITGVAFYNFPYTFGYLLSLGLAERVAAEGPEFLPRYEAFLAQSGSAESEGVAARTLDADLTQRAFWEESLNAVAKDWATFKALADSLQDDSKNSAEG